MPVPSTLRNSARIVLPSDALERIREELSERFALTFFEMDEPVGEGDPVGGRYVRIVGSPVDIKGAADFLGRHGVTIP